MASDWVEPAGHFHVAILLGADGGMLVDQQLGGAPYVSRTTHSDSAGVGAGLAAKLLKPIAAGANRSAARRETVNPVAAGRASTSTESDLAKTGIGKDTKLLEWLDW